MSTPRSQFLNQTSVLKYVKNLTKSIVLTANFTLTWHTVMIYISFYIYILCLMYVYSTVAVHHADMYNKAWLVATTLNYTEP